MRTFSIKRALPALTLGVALVAVLALWAPWAGGGSPRDSSRITGIIEYTVRDASGNLKEQRVIHNATLAALLNAGRDRLGVDGSLTGVGNNDLYDNIQAVNADLSGVGTPTSGQLTTNLDANPKDGANTALSESGNYQTLVTFTASGAATIEELQLTKGAATSGTPETPGAYQNVSITLASGDTL